MKMTDHKNNPAENAELKIEVDGFIYFYSYIEDLGLGLYKARPDGSELTMLVDVKKQKWDALRNLEYKDGCLYLEAIYEYSNLNEEAYEYDRYRDNIVCKIKLNGEELMEVSRSKGYLGSSN